MAEWTPEAREYLDGYLKQVRALARGAGEDGDDIASGLREHIIEKTERESGPLVTLEVLRRALAEVGTPEAIVDDPASWQTAAKRVVRLTASVRTTPPVAPPIVPPVAPPPRDRSGRFLRWTLGCLVLLIIGMIALPILGVLAGIGLPAMSRAREAAQRAECQNHLKQIGITIMQWEDDHPDWKGDPQKLSDFYPEVIQDIELFACPSSPETDRNPSTLDKWCSYEFNTAWNGKDDDPIIVEKVDSNHVPPGRHVLYKTGRVEFRKAGASNVQSSAEILEGNSAVNTADPLSVARAFASAIAAKNIRAALDHVEPDLRPSLESELSANIPGIPEQFELRVESLVENESAQVQVEGTEVGFDLAYRNGRWWIAH